MGKRELKTTKKYGKNESYPLHVVGVSVCVHTLLIRTRQTTVIGFYFYG